MLETLARPSQTIFGIRVNFVEEGLSSLCMSLSAERVLTDGDLLDSLHIQIVIGAVLKLD